MSSFSEIRSGLLKKYNVRSSDEEERKRTKSTTTVSAPDTTSDFYSIRENLLGKYSQENVTQRRQAVSDWTSRYNKVMENLSSGFGDSGKWKTGQDMDSMEVEIGSLLRISTPTPSRIISPPHTTVMIWRSAWFMSTLQNSCRKSIT